MGYFIMAWLFYRRLAIFIMASLFGLRGGGLFLQDGADGGGGEEEGDEGDGAHGGVAEPGGGDVAGGEDGAAEKQ